MIARTRNYLLLITVLVLLVYAVGCGGGGGSSAGVPVDASLFTPNYISELGGLYHWNHLPVKVSCNLPADWQQEYGASQQLYQWAANEWNQPGKQVLVMVVPWGTPADVPITFVNQSELGGNTQGITSYTYDLLGRMRSAKIKVGLYDSHGNALSVIDAQTTIAHEIGHALGIGGHSPNIDDLMYFSHIHNDVQLPTTYDLNTAMSAYPSYFGRAGILGYEGDDSGPVYSGSIE